MEVELGRGQGRDRLRFKMRVKTLRAVLRSCYREPTYRGSVPAVPFILHPALGHVVGSCLLGLCAKPAVFMAMAEHSDPS